MMQKTKHAFDCLKSSPFFQKFLFFVLKSSDVLDILVPILYFLNDARADQCKSFISNIWDHLCLTVELECF